MIQQQAVKWPVTTLNDQISPHSHMIHPLEICLLVSDIAVKCVEMREGRTCAQIFNRLER